MRVLLTGASGLIGGHVAAALADAGMQVRALCRSEPTAAVDEHVAADVRDREAVRAAARGCDAAIHTAALYAYGRRAAPEMAAINVEGTRNVLDACRRAGVDRVVVTSSAATCGPVAGRPADERDEPPPFELSIPYKRTKIEAERVALAAARAGQDVVIVNPSTTIGPGDERPTPSGRMIADVVSGRARAHLAGAWLNVVAARDVARGHVLALEHGRRGERYLLGGEDLPLSEVFAIAARHAGRRAPRIGLPYPLVLAVAHMADAACTALRREPELLVLDEVRLARLPMRFSSAKARRELGYAPGPAAAAIAATAEWFSSRRPAPSARRPPARAGRRARRAAPC